MTDTSDFLSSSKKSHAHPLAQFLTDEDFELANEARKSDEQKEQNFISEIKRRGQENTRILKSLKPVGLDREAELMEEIKNRFDDSALKRYERDISGTKVRTRDELKWQLGRKKARKDLDINSLKWQEENRKRQLLSLAENDIVRDIRIQRGVEIEESDHYTSTTELTQGDLLEQSDLNTQAKVFSLSLPNKAGGYRVRYNASGRHMLIVEIAGGGNVVSLDWKKLQIVFEINFQDSFSDGHWIMDDTMIALCSRRNLLVLNDKGEEIHRVKDLVHPKFVQYLPYHFTLVGADAEGNIKYKDISIGDTALSVQMKPITAFTQNPSNGIMICGHADGQISMVTPRDKSKEPVVSMLCHKSPIRHIEVDLTGTFMVTSSAEGITKVWEIKKTFKEVCKFKSEPLSAVAISQSGMIALGIRNQVLIWRHVSQLKRKHLYLQHGVQGGALVSSLCFCPYEDILGIGTTKGVSQILVPGSGLSEFDSRTYNPFTNDSTLRKLNVDMLIEKVPLDMISLDPNLIGTSGIQQKFNTYDGHVEMTETLKKELEGMGITQKVERKKLSQISREELRKQREEEDAKLKEGINEWYEDSNPNPLDRFASLGKRKRKLEDEREAKRLKEEEGEGYEDENEDSDEAEAEDDNYDRNDLDEDDIEDDEGMGEDEEDIRESMRRKKEFLQRFQSDDSEEELGEMYKEIPEDSDEDSDASSLEDGEDDNDDSDNSDDDDEQDSDSSSEKKSKRKPKQKTVVSDDESAEDSDEDSDDSDNEAAQKRMLSFSLGR